MERRPILLSVIFLSLSVIQGYLVVQSNNQRSIASRLQPLGETPYSKYKSSSQGATTARDRWDRLNPKTSVHRDVSKPKTVEENDDRGMSLNELKRRRMFFMREKDRERKRAGLIDRPWSDTDRTPLALLSPGIKTVGIVISLTNFGAYVDIGTDVDGLLHVSQISHEEFISHPRQKLSPGQEVTVTIRRLSADLKKLHLTMLPEEILQEEKELKEMGERIPLDELQVDDELWGELKRVTDYGAFVEIGCVVDGFLHFMDHPDWADNKHPSAFMKRGDRVRIWVSDVDQELNRVKLTAIRPDKLPGPRPDAFFL